MHLDGWSVRCLAHPQIKILALARLKEENIVAVVKFGELVKLVKFGLGVELDVLAGVWEKRVEIVQEMAMSVVLLVLRCLQSQPRIAYLIVTPREDRIKTFCLFLLIVLLAPSVGLSTDLVMDLYTDAMLYNLCCFG